MRRALPLLFWFLDAGNNETVRRLSSPASEKRQCTKSREVWLLPRSGLERSDFVLWHQPDMPGHSDDVR